MNNCSSFKWVRLLVALFFFIGYTNLEAQKISRYYTSSAQNAGMLYFIKPQKGFASNVQNAHLVYDITTFAKSDSVTFNFTFTSSKALHLVEAEFNVTASSVRAKAVKLYIETKKLNWVYRYSLRLSKNELMQFFNASKPPSLLIHCTEEVITLKMPKRQWQKLSARNRRIFELIALN